MKYRECILIISTVVALSACLVICVWCVSMFAAESTRLKAEGAVQQARVTSEQKTEQVKNRTLRFPWIKKEK